MKSEIYLVTSHLYSGGTASVTKLYYDMYKRNGHNVKCIVLDESRISTDISIPADDIIGLGLNLNRYSISGNFHRVLGFLSRGLTFRRFCENNDGIYIFVHFEPILLGCFTFFLGSKMRKIYTVHTNIFQYYQSCSRLKRLLLFVFFRVLKQSHALVFLTEDVEKKFIEKYRYKNVSDNIPNISNYLTSSSVKQIGDIGICFCGRLSAEKGADLIVPIYNEYRRMGGNLKLTIMGDGPLNCIVKKQRDKSDFKNDISLLGHVDNVSEVFKSSKVLLVLSKTEGFGLVIIEALSNGIPVIASNCPSGPSSIISNDSNVPFDTELETQFGLLLPIASEANIERYALALLDYEGKGKLSEEQVKGLMDRYSEKTIYKRWESVINAIE